MKKFVALFIALTFFASGISTPLSHAEMAVPNLDRPLLIHIQVAHRQVESEKDIENILKNISKEYGIKLLLLEGAASRLHPELFRFFPQDKDLNLKITNALVEKGELTGAESFLIHSPDQFEGWGIEDLEAYRKNREAFKAVIQNQKSSEQILHSMWSGILKSIQGPELEKFIQNAEAYQEKNISLSEWLDFLKKEAEKILSLNFRDVRHQRIWPVLTRYFKLKSLSFDEAAFQEEKQTFLAEFKWKPVVLDLGHSSQTRFFFEKLYDQLPGDYSFSKYPNLRLYIQHQILTSELDGKRLFQEFELLENQIEDALAKSPKEKSSLAAFRDYQLLKKLLRLELTREEWEEIKTRDTRQGTKDQNNNSFKSLVTRHLSFVSAFEFYRLAEAREAHFFESIQNILKSKKQNKAVLITGGFHANGLKESFQKAGFTYLPMTPKLTELNKNARADYLRSVLGERNVEKAQLEAFLRTDVDSLRGLEDSEFARDVESSIRKTVLGTVTKVRPREAIRLSQYFDQSELVTRLKSAASLGRVSRRIPTDEFAGKIKLNRESGQISFAMPGPVVQPAVTLWVMKNDPANQAGIIATQLDQQLRSGRILVVSSASKPAKDAASNFLDQLMNQKGIRPGLVVEPLLNDINFGLAEGKKEGELSDSQQRAAARYRALDATANFRDGESFLDLMLRQKKLLEKFNQLYGNKGINILLFGHEIQLAALRTVLGDPKLLNGQGIIDWRIKMISNGGPVLLIRGEAASLGLAIDPPGNIKLMVVPDKKKMAQEVATRMIEAVKKALGEKGKAVLGLATGGTMEDVYAEVIRMFKEDQSIDFSNVSTFNLDEYRRMEDVYLDEYRDKGSPYDRERYQRFNVQTYDYYMHEKLFDRLREIDAARAFKPGSTHVFDAFAQDPKEEINRFLDNIRNHGGVDWQVLGIGSDGHYAFLEPAIVVNRNLVNELAQVEKEANELGKEDFQASQTFRKIRDFNEFVIEDDITQEELPQIVSRILALRSRARSKLDHFPDLVDRLRKSRIKFFESRKQSPPPHHISDDVLKRELDSFGHRILEEQETIFYTSTGRWEGATLPTKRVHFEKREAFFGSPAKEVSLAIPTALDNSRYFEFLYEIPIKALTQTGIVREAKEIVLAATGEGKQDAIFHSLARPVTPEWTASILQEHPQTVFIVDEESARKIPSQIRDAAQLPVAASLGGVGGAGASEDFEWVARRMDSFRQELAGVSQQEQLAPLIEKMETFKKDTLEKLWQLRRSIEVEQALDELNTLLKRAKKLDPAAPLNPLYQRIALDGLLEIPFDVPPPRAFENILDHLGTLEKDLGREARSIDSALRLAKETTLKAASALAQGSMRLRSVVEVLDVVKRFVDFLDEQLAAKVIKSSDLRQRLSGYLRDDLKFLSAFKPELFSFNLKFLGNKRESYEVIALMDSANRVYPATHRPGVFGDPRGDLESRVFYEGATAVFLEKPPGWKILLMPENAYLVAGAYDKVKTMRTDALNLKASSLGKDVPTGSRRQAELYTDFWSTGSSSAFGERFPENLYEFWRNYFISIRRLNSKARVLDIGTGTMQVLRIAQRISDEFELHGVDLAQIPDDGNLPGIHFHTVNAENLPDQEPFLSDSFDIVTSMYGIEYSDMDKTLVQLKRVLKPNGKAVFLMHHKDSGVAAEAKDQLRNLEAIRDTQAYENLVRFLEDPSPVHKTALDESQSRLVSGKLQKENSLIDFTLFMAEQDRDKALALAKGLRRKIQIGIELKQWLIQKAAAYGNGDEGTLREIMTRNGFEIDKLEVLRDKSNDILGWNVELHRAASLGMAKLSTQEIVRRIDTVWDRVGDKMAIPFSPEAQSAFEEINPLVPDLFNNDDEEEISLYAYFQVLVAQLFGKGNVRPTLRFFDELGQQSTGLASEVFNNDDFVRVYLISRLLDRASIQTALDKRTGFFKYYTDEIKRGGRRNYFFGDSPQDEIASQFEISRAVLGFVGFYLEKKEFQNALQVIDNLMIVASNEEGIDPEKTEELTDLLLEQRAKIMQERDGGKAASSLGEVRKKSRVEKLFERFPALGIAAQMNQIRGGGRKGFVGIPIFVMDGLVSLDSPELSNFFVSESQSSTVKRRIFDYRSLPKNPSELDPLLVYAKDHPDVDYTLFVVHDPRRAESFRNELELFALSTEGVFIPKNFKVEFVKSVDEMKQRINQAINQDSKTPSGFVSEDPVMAEIGYRPNLVRVAGSQKSILQNATALLVAERLSKELTMDMFYLVQNQEDIAPETVWTGLVESLKRREAFLASA